MAGVALALALASASDRSPSVVAGMAVIAACAFLALVLGAKVLTGQESLNFFHHLGAITAACAGFLWLVGAPVLAFLDLAVLGVFAFLACGRMGCLAVGCCHGRPWRRGIVYGDEQVAEGFTAHLAGVPLVPVQAFEAAWALMLVAAGSAVVVTGGPAGGGLVVALCLYAAGRWVLEFLRGDPGRPYLLGFSEAQWTSLAAAAALALAGGQRLIPFGSLATTTTAVLLIATAGVALARRGGAYPLLLPAHVAEVAAALRGLEARRNDGPPGRGEVVTVATTSLGLRVSGAAEHVSISRRGSALSRRAARAVGRLIGRLRPGPGPRTVVAGGHGVFHVLARGDARGL